MRPRPVETLLPMPIMMPSENRSIPTAPNTRHGPDYSSELILLISEASNIESSAPDKKSYSQNICGRIAQFHGSGHKFDCHDTNRYAGSGVQGNPDRMFRRFHPYSQTTSQKITCSRQGCNQHYLQKAVHEHPTPKAP